MTKTAFSKYRGRKELLIMVDEADRVPEEVSDTIDALSGEDLDDVETETNTTGTLCANRDRKGGYLVP